MNAKFNVNSNGGRKMLPIQKILCPTDFSIYSRHAIDVARELATYFQAELILLNVISDVPTLPEAVPTNFDIDGYKKALVSSSQSSLKKIARGIDDNNDLKVRSVAVEGNPSERITKQARKEDVDLIVISSHSRRGKSRLVFGSVAEKALRLTPCPVLVVPAYPDKRPDEAPGRHVLSVNVDESLEDHLEHLTDKLDAVEKNIEERKQGIDNLFRRRLAELEMKDEDIQRKLDRIRRSSSEAWEEIRTGFSDLWAVFDRAFAKFRSGKKDWY